MMTYILIGAVALGILLIVYSLLVYKPKDPNSSKRDIFLIVGGVLVLAVGPLFLFVLQPAEMSDEADLFFEKLHKGDVAGAHSMTASKFQSTTTVDHLAQFSELFAFDKLSGTSYSSMKYENNEGFIEGNIIYDDGRVQPIRVDFVKENEEWKVLHVAPKGAIKTGSTESGATPEAPLEHEVAPSDEAAKRLVNESIIMLADAIAKRDFSTFYSYSSNMWQSQTTKEELLTAFQEFIDKKIDLIHTQNKTITIVSNEIDLQNALDIDAVWDTKPVRTTGNFRYVNEGGKWKIIGIAVNLKE